MTEKDWPKCDTEGCDSDCFISYVWPGKEERTYACAIHGMIAKTVANTAGFTLGDVRNEAEEEMKRARQS